MNYCAVLCFLLLIEVAFVPIVNSAPLEREKRLTASQLGKGAVVGAGVGLVGAALYAGGKKFWNNRKANAAAADAGGADAANLKTKGRK
ncbi:hypothetical protein niasHT_025756 [Heterodera trifolii]|uniref:Uncharacterized protein n=1 Tax=Heterodera trifolii TaxID=157864 RepID=A0ABD2KD40_9BILA